MHMTFTNGLKRKRKVLQSSFYFCQLLVMKDHSFLSEACSGIKSVDGSMKLHAAFPSTPDKLWVRNTSCFCQNCFGTSFKPETACDCWRMVDLQRKRNPSILSSSEKTVEI